MLNIHNTSIQDSSSIVSRFLRDGVGCCPAFSELMNVPCLGNSWMPYLLSRHCVRVATLTTASVHVGYSN